MRDLKKHFKNFNTWIMKFIPKEDKLRHYFLGSLFFLLLSIFLKDITSLLITLIAAIIWEVIQKIAGGKNSKKQMALDVFFSVILAILVNIINSF